MSSSITSTNNGPFWLLATFSIVLTAGLSASAWPAVHLFTVQQSQRLTLQVSGTSQSDRLNYHLAHLLDPSNSVAARFMAQEALGHDDAASAVRYLKAATFSNDDLPYLSLATKTQLELGNTANAGNLASLLIANQRSSDADILLAAVALTISSRGEEAGAATSRLSSIEARQRLVAIQSDKLAAALELSRLGLLHASERVLIAAGESVPRNLQLARITLALSQGEGRGEQTQAQTRAITLLKRALQLDPVHNATRKELIRALTLNGDAASAAQEQQRLDQLTSGKP